MLAFPEMLKKPAERAGIKVPENLTEFDKAEYPHWHVYVIVQLGAPLPHPQAHWDNAEVIAAIPAEELKTITIGELREKGLAVHRPIP